MRTLWELTRGMARIVDALLGRVGQLEKDVASQKRRISDIERGAEPDFRGMELRQEEKTQRHEVRQNALTDDELRVELREQYGTSNWAKKLISGIIGARRGRHPIGH